MTAQDKEVCYPICCDLRSKLEDDNTIFTSCIRLRDEDTFQLFGHLKRDNVRIWGTNNPHEWAG